MATLDSTQFRDILFSKKIVFATIVEKIKYKFTFNELINKLDRFGVKLFLECFTCTEHLLRKNVYRVMNKNGFELLKLTTKPVFGTPLRNHPFKRSPHLTSFNGANAEYVISVN